MRISLDWLKRYVDVPCTARELGHALTMTGFPVPSIDAAGDDSVLEVEITSNRPDLLSHLGVAREVAGLVGSHVRHPAVSLPPLLQDRIDVRVDAPDLCPRYVARVVRGVRVGPSPAWLVRALEAVGQRSVNNVVDVTNFVMLECGQPLHAFDMAKLRGPAIVVRRAAGEPMTAIDGRKLVVGADELAICDAVGPVALAGVMGGADSEVSAATRDLVLEIAAFAPASVRAASRAHQIRSEAAYRFERFVDAAAMDWAADRAASLLVEVCGATSVGTSCSAGPGFAAAAPEITLRASQIERVVGIPVAADEARAVLVSLGLEPARGPASAGASRWIPPSWRPDLAAEIDLIEEVARRIGFERVPDEVKIPVRPSAHDPQRRGIVRLRDTLAGAGLRECCTAPFVGEGASDIALLRQAPALRVDNPMRSDESLLRRSLLGPLLAVARGNRDRGVPAVRLFEIAPIYVRGADAASDEEVLLASGVLTGSYAEAKGCVESVLDVFGLADAATFDRGAPLPLRRDRSATLRIGDAVLGCVGELPDRALARFGLASGTVLFELNASLLMARGSLECTYRPVARFPAIERDLAWVVDESVSWHTVATVARDAAGPLLTAIAPFDVYRGAPTGEGRKSVALRMEFRAADRTLTGAEADACVARVVAALAERTGGRLRS